MLSGARFFLDRRREHKLPCQVDNGSRRATSAGHTALKIPFFPCLPCSDAIHYTNDQELPTQGPASLLRDRIKGWHPGQARSTAARSTDGPQRGNRPSRHERYRVEAAQGTTQRANQSKITGPCRSAAIGASPSTSRVWTPSWWITRTITRRTSCVCTIQHTQAWHCANSWAT